MARYDAFILRVWRSGTADDRQWSGRVEHLPQGKILRFSSVAALLAYLAAELAIECDPAAEPPKEEGKGVMD